MKNQIYIDRDFGWFCGVFDKNQKHRHYAIQLSVPLDEKIIIETPQLTIKSDAPILIKSNTVHRVISDTPHFLLLVNPASTIGHFWNHVADKEAQKLGVSAAIDLQNFLVNYRHQPLPASEINSQIKSYDCFCKSAIHQGDGRIEKALTYLLKNAERIVPVEEIANHSRLSPSRFLHLFKQETGITYRRSQLWNKLTKSLSQLSEMSLTELAYANGFSDSAHFSRTFKENFGFSPRDFLKIS